MYGYQKNDEKIANEKWPTLSQADTQEERQFKEELRLQILGAQRRLWLNALMSDVDRMQHGEDRWEPVVVASAVLALAVREASMEVAAGLEAHGM